MNYIWSKLSLLKFLEESIWKVVKEDSFTFSDLFAWTGIVGRYFKEKWHKVIANDLQYYSYVLNRHYIWNHKELIFDGLMPLLPELKDTPISDRKDYVCRYLNNLKWVKWFLYNNYCLGGTKKSDYQRMYFSDENGKKCDHIRTTIEEWKDNNYVTDDEYYFLLTTLIEAIDKVANTASVYGAFLKKLKKTALKPINLNPAHLFIDDHDHDVYNSDINTVITETEHDVVYLDPPYNHRQYSGNYHILETIAKYDNPKIKGKTGMRDCSWQKSLYCSRQQVKNAFMNLISNIKAKYVFLSYNDEWLMSLEDIKEVMSTRGEYGFFTQEYGRFKADKSENRDYKKNSVIEYLHYVKII